MIKGEEMAIRDKKYLRNWTQLTLQRSNLSNRTEIRKVSSCLCQGMKAMLLLGSRRPLIVTVGGIQCLHREKVERY